MRISDRAKSANASGIRRMFDLASRLEDPLDLSIGQPDFPPPPEAIEAAYQAMKDGHNRYTQTQGLPALNEAILDHLEQRGGRRPESSLVTCGVAGALTLATMALLDPGERLLMPDPNFVCYPNLAWMLGCEPVTYDLYPDFHITEERLEAGMCEGVAALIVNSPGNPTGQVLLDEELATVAAFARRHHLAVISDEIYDCFSYDAPAPSMLKHHEETLVLGGFSKTMGMPGWRIGYAAGPLELIDRMRTLQQFSFVCAPTPAQHGVLAAMAVDPTPHIDAYRKKRDLVVSKLSGEFELASPKGAFFAFPRAPGNSATKFVERAIKKELLVVPGTAFSKKDTHFRLSFALSDSRLESGLDLLCELAGETAASLERQ